MMKLSEAMRLGAMMKPQVRQDYGNDLGTCAIGAVCDAIGKLDSACSMFVSTVFPILNTAVQCPATGRKAWMLNVILRLNDTYLWSREAIADWVESIENAQTTPATSREEAGTVALLVTTSASAAK